MAQEDRVDPGVASRQSHLTFQFDFLRASAERYEQGHEHEAQRLAVAIRLLCYDGNVEGKRPNARVSQSLFRQLGLLDQWRWIDTATAADDHTPGPTPFGPLILEQFRGAEGLIGNWWAAPLSDFRSRETDFPTWWKSPILHDKFGGFSREDLVRCVAEQDGGAHVDYKLSAKYHRISREWSAYGYPGRSIDPWKTIQTPVWEFIRQVTFEIQLTAHRADPDRFQHPTERGGMPADYGPVASHAFTVRAATGPPLIPARIDLVLGDGIYRDPSVDNEEDE